VSKPEDRVGVRALGGGRYQVEGESGSRIGYAVRSRDTWVFFDGNVYVIADATRAVRRGQSDDQGALTSPMPATVLAIHAAPGQRVTQDDVLIVLEAMKMELPIRAPRDGIVSRVACRVGELVQPGVMLIDLAEAGAEG
jgi:acetyl-CoA/propionyl-CoA carboxylase biotin carboxyl carrier protein